MKGHQLPLFFYFNTYICFVLLLYEYVIWTIEKESIPFPYVPVFSGLYYFSENSIFKKEGEDGIYYESEKKL